MWHVDHLIPPEAGPEIFKLASRHHHRRIDPCEKVLVESFEAFRYSRCWQMKRSDKGTWQQRARTKDQIELLITI